MAAGTKPTPRVPSRSLIILGAALSVSGVFGLMSAPQRPVILWNGTPSEPEGLYLLTSKAPAKGGIIAFHVPPAAFPYADRRLGFLRTVPVLKTIAAAGGENVCLARGILSVDGRSRGGVARADFEGHVLPRWVECRALRRDEFFVFSDRVPNSFDSRYFGPVSRAEVVGVYRPWLVLQAVGG